MSTKIPFDCALFVTEFERVLPTAVCEFGFEIEKDFLIVVYHNI